MLHVKSAREKFPEPRSTDGREASWVLFRPVIERMNTMPQKYPASFRERAVRMVADRLREENAPSRYTIIRETAQKLGVSTEGLRRWVLQSEIDSGKMPGVTRDAAEEIRRLKRENAELRRANEILKTASAFFAAELDRPTTR